MWVTPSPGLRNEPVAINTQSESLIRRMENFSELEIHSYPAKSNVLLTSRLLWLADDCHKNKLEATLSIFISLKILNALLQLSAWVKFFFNYPLILRHVPRTWGDGYFVWTLRQIKCRVNIVLTFFVSALLNVRVIYIRVYNRKLTYDRFCLEFTFHFILFLFILILSSRKIVVEEILFLAIVLIL